MQNRRASDNKKGDMQLHRAKFIVGCTLIGSVIAGALFGWIPMAFDIRLVGASVGLITGVAAGHMA